MMFLLLLLYPTPGGQIRAAFLSAGGDVVEMARAAARKPPHDEAPECLGRVGR